MRHARIKADGEGCYHIVSRIVDRTFRLDDSEKEIFRSLMRRVETFCGVHILTYAILSNHFHLLLEVPVQSEIDESELVRRVTALYGKIYVSNMLQQWNEWRSHGMGYLVENQKDKFKLRMEDVSAFVKTLKQRYSMSYNGRHQRKGTLWEDRFKSVLVENVEHAKATVAAYIDLNPVRAKLVADPKDYRWSGYGEATGGGRLARKGLSIIHATRSLEQPGDWKQVSMRYRVLLYTRGGEHHAPYTHSITKPGLVHAEIDRILAAKGRLTLQQALRCRVRYFTDGLAFGGKAFVDGIFEHNRRYFGPNRKDGARKMRFAEWGELRVARALRIVPVHAPVPT